MNVNLALLGRTGGARLVEGCGGGEGGSNMRSRGSGEKKSLTLVFPGVRAGGRASCTRKVPAE